MQWMTRSWQRWGPSERCSGRAGGRQVATRIFPECRICYQYQCSGSASFNGCVRVGPSATRAKVGGWGEGAEVECRGLALLWEHAGAVYQGLDAPWARLNCSVPAPVATVLTLHSDGRRGRSPGRWLKKTLGRFATIDIQRNLPTLRQGRQYVRQPRNGCQHAAAPQQQLCRPATGGQQHHCSSQRSV